MCDVHYLGEVIGSARVLTMCWHAALPHSPPLESTSGSFLFSLSPSTTDLFPNGLALHKPDSVKCCHADPQAAQRAISAELRPAAVNIQS